ncbi:MAG: hypothetical protein NUV80_02915 [Candidatus Berkelbacteria bacterium]|nr:hypothetical protein [Candidatus Berkelbacteria bacterium]
MDNGKSQKHHGLHQPFLTITGGYMLTPEIYFIASGIEDILRRAAIADGLTCVPPIFEWVAELRNATDPFNPGEKSLSYGKYQTTIENKEAYEKLIDLPRHLEIWPEYIRVNYMLSDSVLGTRITAVLRMDIAHPPEYLEALEAAGSLVTRTDEIKFIKCSI